MTDRAIRNLTENRRATRDLRRMGLARLEQGAEGISGDAVHAWTDAPIFAEKGATRQQGCGGPP